MGTVTLSIEVPAMSRAQAKALYLAIKGLAELPATAKVRGSFNEEVKD